MKAAGKTRRKSLGKQWVTAGFSDETKTINKA
jgi:hypothetical protein